ncbi:MAG: hypothetical protein DWQ36_09245 [Acidobacteria bacterium]|nr:MAG: hypothetical protein DWQ30_22490 [Acidobacteriota bacterium]REK08545.1 MAG: hypothetical protein DWQ36_09245 [Acidobacteriota bacterium]
MRLAHRWSISILIVFGVAAGWATDHGESGSVPAEPVPQPQVWEESPSVRGPGSSTRFLFVAGSNFRARDSSTTFSYLGGGCLQRNSNVGDSWFTYDLDLPHGAVIDFLRVYYFDNTATYNVNSELWAFDGAGGTELVAEADGSGTPGYSSAGSGFFARTVDSVNDSFVIVASIQGGVGSSIALCGVRVRYQFDVPLFGDGFETGDTSAWSATVGS